MEYSRPEMRARRGRPAGEGAAGKGRLVRPLRFCAVGLCALLVNTLTLWLLTERGRLGVIPASALANEAAVLSSFVLNDRWTFAAKGRHKPRLWRLLRFNGVALGGIVISVVLLGALAALLPINLLLANLLAVAAGSIWNYTVGSRWAWGGGEAS